MRRDNRQFVKNVIIVSVIGLIALMILLFVGLKIFLGNNEGVQTIDRTQETQNVDSKVELSQTLLILVHNITEKSVEGFDIKNNRTITKRFLDTTRISDAYGKTLPVTEIKPGDIVRIEFDQDNEKVFAVTKEKEVQSWKKVSGVIVDRDNGQISVGGNNYKYNSNTMILKSDNTQEAINNISPYDVVTIQAYEDTIWSIKVDERAGSISLEDLPVSKGTVEIDYSRLVNFSDIKEPLKVIPGEHKIVIRMPGYEVQIYNLQVSANEVYNISLADAKKAVGKLQISMYSSVSDYTVQIGNKTYKPGDDIELEQGNYTVTITAEGYKPWTKKIALMKEKYMLPVALTPVVEEETNTDSEADNIDTTNSKTITLSTDPDGANVYIDGSMKGQTPYTVTLPYGQHTILFEKDGYEIYSANINLVQEEDQKSFLYVLTQKE